MKKGEKTKNLILEKSLQLISENGYSGTSVRTIASAVGLRESAIYNHFKSKKDVLIEIIKKYGQRSSGLNLLTDELIEQLNKPLKFIQLFSEKLLKNWSDKEQILFLKLVLKENGREIDGETISLNSYIQEAEKIWEMIFTEMIKHKFIKKGDPKVFANQFIAPLFFIRLKFLTNEQNIDFKTALKRVSEHAEFFWENIKR